MPVKSKICYWPMSEWQQMDLCFTLWLHHNQYMTIAIDPPTAQEQRKKRTHSNYREIKKYTMCILDFSTAVTAAVPCFPWAEVIWSLPISAAHITNVGGKGAPVIISVWICWMVFRKNISWKSKKIQKELGNSWMRLCKRKKRLKKHRPLKNDC